MKGIMFKEELFNAILEGKKTATRRIVNIPPEHIPSNSSEWVFQRYNPRYNKGEIVYLKEPYGYNGTEDFESKIVYKYDKCYTPELLEQIKLSGGKWKNKMFMPEKYARYFIEIVKIGVERLQDITEQNAKDEGVDMQFCLSLNEFIDRKFDIGKASTYKIGFMNKWDEINGKGSWKSNPWIWVYEFKLTTNT